MRGERGSDALCPRALHMKVLLRCTRERKGYFRSRGRCGTGGASAQRSVPDYRPRDATSILYRFAEEVGTNISREPIRFYERGGDSTNFVERSGRAVAHDEERWAFERGWAKGLPQVQ